VQVFTIAAGIILVANEKLRPLNVGKELPGCSANDAVPFILPFDSVELKINELSYVSDKREDFANTVVHQRNCCKKIDDSASNGMNTLRRRYEIYEKQIRSDVH